MLFDKIIEFAKQHGWKEQACGKVGGSCNFGTNFYKNGQFLSISVVEEGHMAYPDEDEIEEMFGHVEDIGGDKDE